MSLQITIFILRKLETLVLVNIPTKTGSLIIQQPSFLKEKESPQCLKIIFQLQMFISHRWLRQKKDFIGFLKTIDSEMIDEDSSHLDQEIMKLSQICLQDLKSLFWEEVHFRKRIKGMDSQGQLLTLLQTLKLTRSDLGTSQDIKL